jgi:hypothetical protein
LTFVWHREPDRAWVHDLRSVSAPTEGLSHAELWWEAGLPWAPVQRWVLYNLHPIANMQPGGEDAPGFWNLRRYLELEAPCRCARAFRPSDTAYQCRDCGGARTQGRERIYRTFMDRGYFAQPMWIIQGDHGGHKVTHSGREQILARAMGLDADPPAPGSLPYAEWDWRVKRHLVDLDISRSSFASLTASRRDRQAGQERLARVRSARRTFADLDAFFESLDMEDGFLDTLPREDRRPVDLSDVLGRYEETGRLSPN